MPSLSTFTNIQFDVYVVLLFFVFLLVFRLLRGSFVYIPNDQYGIVERKWAFPWKGKVSEPFSPMALNGGAGYLPGLLYGGWHFLPPFQCRVYKKPLIRIDNNIGYVVARVGSPLRAGQALAEWPGDIEITDARSFLEKGGQAGPQRHILRSKLYAIHLGLFCVITENNIFTLEGGGGSADDKAIQTMLKNRKGFEPIIISDDKIGIITVQDGPALSHGEIIAPTVGADVANSTTFHNSFQDIPKFLAAGGRRGRQEQVLVEGTYYINRLFSTVEVASKTRVGIGTVGVVCSYVGAEDPTALSAESGRGRTVAKGQRGIWSTPLEPGMYPINPFSAEITHVPTTNFKLNWQRGVESKLADARLESNRVAFDGDLTEIPVVTKDAFEFLLQVSIIAHISPMAAPKVIQRFSQVSRLVNQTLDPLVSSFFRDAVQEMTLLDFMNKRAELGNKALADMTERLGVHEITIEEVLIGKPVEESGSDNVERLLDQLRARQIADQQRETFRSQGEAADAERVLNEKRAIAQQQADLTASNIAIAVATNQGKAETEKRKQAADGIRVTAQAEADAVSFAAAASAGASEITAKAVGGTENLMRQLAITKLAEAITSSPHKLVPETIVGGEGGSALLDTLIAYMLKGGVVTQAPTQGRVRLDEDRSA